MSDSESAARILVVNDEAAIREIIVSILTSAGYQCATAADGLEALAVLDSGQEFELLFSNFMMPNLDGIGLLERTHEKFPRYGLCNSQRCARCLRVPGGA